jgi:hypothetical protein
MAPAMSRGTRELNPSISSRESRLSRAVVGLMPGQNRSVSAFNLLR